MKRWSLLLTVILLGAMPLVAAAFDYGPNQPLLAASGSTPQLPGTSTHVATEGGTPRADVVASNDDDAGTPATDSVAQPRPPATPTRTAAPHRDISASNKPHQPPASAKPLPVVPQATWQSLLPGSIQ